jgi:hypothetical protein
VLHYLYFVTVQTHVQPFELRQLDQLSFVPQLRGDSFEDVHDLLHGHDGELLGFREVVHRPALVVEIMSLVVTTQSYPLSLLLLLTIFIKANLEISLSRRLPHFYTKNLLDSY